MFVAGFIGQANLWPCTSTPGANGHGDVTAFGSTSLRAACDTDVASGASGTVMVRPERVEVSDTQPAEAISSVSGTVTDLTFQGPVVRLMITAPDGSPIVANLTHDATLPAAQPGDDVWASWSIEACRVLPEADIPLTDDELVVES